MQLITSNNILEKVSLFLIGMLIAATVFALTTKYLGSYGIWLGIIANAGLVFASYHYRDKGSRSRIISWGILTTLILGSTVFFIALSSISKAMENL